MRGNEFTPIWVVLVYIDTFAVFKNPEFDMKLFVQLLSSTSLQD